MEGDVQQPIIRLPVVKPVAPTYRSQLPFLLERPTVSVVIPTLNEAANLPYVLPRIPLWVDEVILVDGNSKDSTVDIAQQLIPDIRVVMQTTRGKGNALREGFAAATGDIIVMLDADGSMAPEEIPAYVGALISGYDFAKGSRFLQGGGTDDMGMDRYLGNLGFTVLVRMLFGGYYSDLCYGYCAFWKRVLPQLNLQADGFEIETEMNIRALKSGLKVTEVPSFEHPRIHGASNLNTFRDGWRVLKKIFAEFNDAGPWRRMTRENDDFTPAMQLLINEARYLSYRRHSMPPKDYEQAVETLKAARQALLNMEFSNPQVRMRQDYYRKNVDKIWGSLNLRLF